MMKKWLVMILVLALAVTMVACGGEKAPASTDATGETSTAAPQEGTRVIKVTTKFVDEEQTAISLKKVCEAINERSKGSLDLQVFTSGTLPIGKDAMEQVVKGADWIVVDGVNFLGDYVPDYNAITGPFLYTTFDEYFAVLNSDIVKELNAQAAEQNIHVIELDWVFGFRSMETNKPITKPEDMKGLKIRVPESQLYTYTLEAMGASAMQMPYPDTYAAIQQGVIDGVEGSIMSYYGTKQYENCKDYSLTNHLLGVSAVTISESVWNSLTDEQRTIIQEEFDKGSQDNLEATKKLEGEYAEKLKEYGVKFHEVDAAAFREAAKPVFSKFDKWTPGIYDRIMKVLDEFHKENK